jgi:rhodanese-related sulfurtransferase
MARISVGELYRMIEDGSGPTILDIRRAEARAESGWIPGAILVATLSDAPLVPAEEVIVYCDCPNEASAAVLAQELKRRGYKRVRPLAGGFAAWAAEGHAIARD